MDIGIKNRKVAVLLFLLLLLVSGVVLVRGTGLPYRGVERTLPGLGEEAAVHWDRWGVPHLVAGSETDLARILGWIHANDRLTQMEIGRRASRGLLSQVFGERFLQADIFFRTLRLEETADRMYA
ncbi:MAG: penicillin acylase family protein, partial [Thermoanaerobaculia bacterium]|nr:penicillin acylase family protein [Thermoanaerobaculia bacterium]